jgi:hypothetical protein
MNRTRVVEIPGNGKVLAAARYIEREDRWSWIYAGAGLWVEGPAMFDTPDEALDQAERFIKQETWSREAAPAKRLRLMAAELLGLAAELERGTECRDGEGAQDEKETQVRTW